MMDTTSSDHDAWARRLEQLGLAVRRRLLAVRDAGSDLATAVAQEGGDTIFAIDRHVEPALEEEIDRWPDECLPLLLIAEGMGHDGRRRFGPENQPLRFRLLVDPIDGTRNIMYDKRSAWFLAAVTPDRGETTTLADALASVMVELPTSKQGWADSFVGVAGQPTRGRRARVDGSHSERTLTIAPSQAATLRNGFGQVANFFPGTKVLASQLMERIVEATLGEVEPGSAAVFDDQYITTGGQMVELMLGHDRFCCDLRPLFYKALSRQSGQSIRGLECHPYDMAGMLAATNAGVILTDGFGRDLAPPLTVHDGVHWCGYANAPLREAIEPVITAFFAELGVIS